MFKTFALLLSLVFSLNAQADENKQTAGAVDDMKPAMHVMMHKNPSCGCCDIWADHMRSFGFTVDTKADPDIFEFKARYNMPRALMSCHTAIIDGYFVEGHVPAQDILRLLREKPESVSGIAVPGMPLGSPGMEHPSPQAFNTVALLTDGSAYVFQAHAAGENFSADTDD